MLPAYARCTVQSEALAYSLCALAVCISAMFADCLPMCVLSVAAAVSDFKTPPKSGELYTEEDWANSSLADPYRHSKVCLLNVDLT